VHRWFNYRALRQVLFAFLSIVGSAAALETRAACIVPDAAGTAGLPPVGCTYTTPNSSAFPNNNLFILNGLPPASTVDIESNLHSFTGVVEGPGGGLGGNAQTYQASLDMFMTGTGAMSTYSRNLVMPLSSVQTHSAPRISGSTPQSFLTDMFGMQGQITGDPDFDLLRITAGTAFGMPGPGQTKLTRLGPAGSPWNVDSYFDITYRIDFVGKAGGPFSGMSGSTTGVAQYVIGAIPEPTSTMLSVIGCLGVILRSRRRTQY
jgi:hypothetical protein